MVAQFPGFSGFSSYYPIVLASSDALIVPEQMQYIISDVVNTHPNLFKNAPKPLKQDEVELVAQQLQIKFVEGYTNKQILHLKSYL
jgi:hypothetical protein